MIGVNLWENHFSYVFIDEASQATELDMLIPLVIANKRAKDKKTGSQAQIVIAGDPYQLGPVVCCKRVEHLLGKFFFSKITLNVVCIFYYIYI